MNAELKAKWVAALRSGEYRQAHGQIKDVSGYCCIGVLACVKAGRRLDYADAMDGYDIIEREQSSTRAYEALVKLNDKDRKPFPDIANWIEANF